MFEVMTDLYCSTSQIGARVSELMGPNINGKDLPRSKLIRSRTICIQDFPASKAMQCASNSQAGQDQSISQTLSWIHPTRPRPTEGDPVSS